MKVYKTQDIRNVAVLGHGGSGKTTLVEAMAYATGITTRQGKVEDGNTISDYDKEEIKRHFSISTAVVPIEWEFWKINLLDIRDILILSVRPRKHFPLPCGYYRWLAAKARKEAGTKKCGGACEKYNVPRAIFVTNMEDEHADYMKVVEDLRALYGRENCTIPPSD